MEATRAEAEGGQEERLRLIVEAVPNAMLMVDREGRIVLANSEAERSFGYTLEEFVRLKVEDLIPERFRRGHAALRTSYGDDPDRRAMGVGRELRGLRKDGTEMPIEIGLNPIRMGGQHYVLASVIDITTRLRAQEAETAAQQDQLRRSILDSIPLSILATDRDGRILTANPGAEVLLGYRQEELVGSLVSEIDGAPRPSKAGGLPLLHAAADVETTYRAKDGRLIPVNESVVDRPAGSGDDGGFLVVAYDNTKRMEAREHVEYMLNHDALTGLPNRSMVMAHLTEAIAASHGGDGVVAVAVLDLDHFKRVNESLGHHIGDALLVKVAERLVSWVGDHDLVGRLGGDEFIVVFAEDKMEAITARLDAMVWEVLVPVEVSGYELALTASIGGAVFPHDGRDPSTLLMHADIALYDVKAGGRDGIQWFAPRMLQENYDRLALSAALRRALETDELSVVYQPQVDLAAGRVVGFEALARWHSPRLGPVSPDRFIPVAEDGGMINELGRWVLRTACKDVAVLQAELGTRLRVAVNVSPRQVRSVGWVASVAEALESSGLEPEQLEVEITEGLLLEDHEHVRAALTALRRLGVQVVVDDFGQGYSSLAYLTRFPVDKIKIDRSFIRGIASVDDQAAIVDAIIVMAHALGMTVVAEGVETPAQESYLRARSCDEVQGYRYGPGEAPGAVLDAVRRIGVG